MAGLSPSFVGLIFFVGFAFLCAAYYYGAEKNRLEFLANRLNIKAEEATDKNSRSAKIAESLRDLGSPITADKLLQISYLIILVCLVLGFALDVPLVGLLLAVIAYKIPEMYLARRKSVLDFVPKGKKDEYIQLLIRAVKESGYSKEQQDMLLRTLSFT